MDAPLVTVLMPVYNAESFLNKAIDSILNQSYRNIEFLIINDGSTDNSLEIIKSYADNRIRLIENKENKGLIYSLNVGIKEAKGKYIARMDADDISLPKRIEKQCLYLEQHLNVGILSTFIQGQKKFVAYRNSNLNSNDLKTRIIFNNIFNHPTIMFRSSFFEDNKLSYNYEFKHAEDYNLWLTSLKFTDFAIIDEYLLFYENHKDQVSYIFNEEQKQNVERTYKQFFNSINLSFNEEEIKIHKRLFYQDYIFNTEFLISVENWLLKILKNKNLEKLVGKEALKKNISVVWFEVCTSLASHRLDTICYCIKSPVFRKREISRLMLLKFYLKKIKIMTNI